MVKNCSMLIGHLIPCVPMTPIDFGGSCKGAEEVGFGISECYYVFPGISGEGKIEEGNCLWNLHLIL